MLQASGRKSRVITGISREGNALFLTSEAGIIRLIPQTERAVRVSWTENGSFAGEQGAEYADLSESFACTEPYAWKDTFACADIRGWNLQENDREIRLETAQLHLIVARFTGSIRYERPDGTPLLAERAWESKNTESYDSFRPVINENTRVEEAVTPDGIKKRIKEADRVFDRKLCRTRLYLEFAPEERLYGLGQAEEGVWDLRHTTQYLHQANLKIAIPLLLSENGYGILLSTQGTAVFDDTQYGSYLYTEADEYLDYYFLAGSPDEVVGQFRALTGRAAMLPKWAFGYIQSQERYESARELAETAEEFRRRGIGLDALVLDWMSWKGDLWGQKTFDEERFPDPAAMTEGLHEKNVHFMISIWPNMNEECDNYREFQEAGLLLPGSEIYDAFREEGRKLYWKQAEEGLYRYGIDAWWCDSCEPVTPEWSRKLKPEPGEMYHEYLEAASEIMPRQKANVYGMYHARAIYEGQRDWDAKRQAASGGVQKRVVNLTRSGWAGSQRYGTILWSGDICASWETLRRQVAAGLHFCASGMPYWTLDIGAFFVKKGNDWFWNGEYEDGCQDPAYRELYVRWLQYGAFLPVFRSHGTDCRREPWQFGNPGEPFYEAILSAIRGRYRLLLYIYSLAGAVWRENGTMMRPLVFDFPEDKKAAGIMDEYMFGPSLLVCPVTEPMEGEVSVRRIYLPAGTDWYDLYTEERFAGGQEIEARAGIEHIPVYVKAGSILPVMEPGESAGEMEGRDICLQAYAGADGSFTLYEDAGDGYGYENGEYCLTQIRFCDREKTVKWESEGGEEFLKKFRKGSLEVRIVG
ncbi:MAG TPA: glycoside hydrolase family 31 protein [Candidatus Eisenbergiella merdipullorum]|uniref:Glycoside hydrolase family 31 protein n=1 Tax=Candidatus Eisenbergiella merdipullorum TaxID=2838553 RepID=A0A9D2I3C5_9FIRM|nr:glycoside hydrolase family 31 protein [Candidatus Eisenbergiella merdipullorum]